MSRSVCGSGIVVALSGLCLVGCTATPQSFDAEPSGHEAEAPDAEVGPAADAGSPVRAGDAAVGARPDAGGAPSTAGTGGAGFAGAREDAGTDAAPPIDADPDADAGGAGLGGGIGDCSLPGAYDPLVARSGETCYAFRSHALSSPTDTTPLAIPVGERSFELDFDVPWNAGDVMTRYGADFDNLPVLHDWQAFATSLQPNGGVRSNVDPAASPDDLRLLAAWSVGGCNVTLPADVGVELPASGTVRVRWHTYNTTGAPQPDASSVQICTVPAGARAKLASFTWLGSEDFGGGIAPGAQTVQGACTNDSGQAVRVIGWLPLMHLSGVSMKTEVMRQAGGTELVFEMPFQFDYQVAYGVDPPLVVQPGDTLVTTCAYQNTTGASVPFGAALSSELCYQLALAYPAGALSNGAPSAFRLENACW